MANVLQTLAHLSRDASIMLGFESIAAPLFAGAVNQTSVDKNSGGSVRITYVPKQTAQTVDHTSGSLGVDATDINEYSVDVSALHYVAVKHTLTSRQLSYEIDEFNQKVTLPAMQGIGEAVDARIINKLAIGAGGVTGSAGTAPSTIAHIVAGRKAFQDNGVPIAGSVGLWGTTAEASFLQLAQFTSGDYGNERPSALRDARLGRLFGIDHYASGNTAGGTLADGDVAGTVLSDGAVTASPSATTIHLDGFTTATAAVNAGAKFTLAGDSTEYTVTADVTCSGNEGDFPIRPALQSDLADGVAVTWVGDVTKDMIVQPGGVAAGIVAPAPLANNSAVTMANGMSVRITVESSTGSSSTAPGDTIEFATYVACDVIQPTCVEIVQG